MSACELKTGSSLHGFEILKNDELSEIDGRAIQGKHSKSGARLLYLQNDDNNKSFAIGFRTPPKDNTGVFHILEHSVLCGSQRFPVKEPFVDLLKSSMKTFLNAMTFADKTLYPVASTNEKDLFNLMDVYLDAVFHPNIYKKRQIFEQEGWHLELSDGQLSYNGVVFNEMKGALSDANSVLYDELQSALLPNTCYAFESGGKPEDIPSLTYENFLDEHRRHYRTDNSYIILYGNLNIERALAFLDERYLSPVADEQRERDEQRIANGLEPLIARNIDKFTTDIFVREEHELNDDIKKTSDANNNDMVEVELQMCERCGGSTEPVKVKVPAASAANNIRSNTHARPVAYQRREMNTAPENACAGCAYLVAPTRNHLRSVATEILLDALFGSNEAPCKRSLLDAGIAHDVQAFLSDALMSPFVVVQLQMPAENAGKELAELLKKEVGALLDEGLDLELIEATISHEEFSMREHDFGMADGVVNSMTALSSWLYDDNAATDYLRFERLFAELRAKLNEGFFETLARELFCENEYVTSVEIVPVQELEDPLTTQLKQRAAKLNDADYAQIQAEEALLRELQTKEDAPEDIATLPRLSIAEIGKAAPEPSFELIQDAAMPCLRHQLPTRGIAYSYQHYDLRGVSFEDLPYVSILTKLLGKLDTNRHSAAQLDTLMQSKLGNLSFYTNIYESRTNPEDLKPKLVCSASALSAHTEYLATLPREIMLETDFSTPENKSKILNILQQCKISIEQTFANSGHACAKARVKSYCTPAGVIREQMSNVNFYRFLCNLLDHFEEDFEDLEKRLASVAERVFNDEHCLLSFAGTDADYERFWAAGPATGRSGGSANNALTIPHPGIAREAFIVPSDVCYTACGWDRRYMKAPHSGALLVAARALSYDFLWNEVRVKGGAYGTGFTVTHIGNLDFYSYRDPHLNETLERFAQASQWLANFAPNQQDLEGFIVATTAGIDAPLKPRAIIRRQLSDYFSGYSAAERAKRRQEVLSTTSADLQALSPLLKDVVDAGAVCVFGNKEIIEGAQADFDVVTLVG